MINVDLQNNIDQSHTGWGGFRIYMGIEEELTERRYLRWTVVLSQLSN